MALHYGLTVKSRETHALVIMLLYFWFTTSYSSQLEILSIGPDLHLSSRIIETNKHAEAVCT